MGKMWKIVLWIALGIYLPLVFSFIAVDRSELVCKTLNVCVVDSATARFVTPGEIKRAITNQFGSFKGTQLNGINTGAVEQLLLKYQAIEYAEVFGSPAGSLSVRIKQRTPVLRVFHEGQTYFWDGTGVKVPIRGTYLADIMILNGNVHKIKDKNDLLELTRYIENHAFWRAQIEQIYIQADGDIVLIPRVGDHRIVLGSVEDMDVKFRNLKALYTNGLHPLEWNSYHEINLKYKGQVICAKP
jgi:cell division protein FtsQ